MDERWELREEQSVAPKQGLPSDGTGFRIASDCRCTALRAPVCLADAQADPCARKEE